MKWNSRFDHVTCNIYETLQKLAAIFTHDDCMQPQKPMLLPNTGWNHISVVALGKLECKMKHLPFSGIVHQLIQLKKRCLLIILLLQAICPYWLRTAPVLVLVSTCHVLLWHWNNFLLLACVMSFQVTNASTWWVKLSQHMPNCISKAMGRWVHLYCSKQLGHLKPNLNCNNNN